MNRSIPYYDRARKVFEKASGEESVDVGYVITNIADTLVKTGRVSEAEENFRKALGIFERAEGSRSIPVAMVLNHLGELFRRKSQWNEALKHYEKAIAIYEEREVSDKNYGGILSNIGLCHLQAGQLDLAEKSIQQGLEVTIVNVGGGDPQVGLLQNNLGTLYLKKKEFAKAEGYLLAALEIFEKRIPESHPDFTMLLQNLAHVYAESDMTRSKEFEKRAQAVLHKDPSARESAQKGQQDQSQLENDSRSTISLPTPMMKWTSSGGKTIKASVVAIDHGKETVAMQLENGKRFSVSFDKFSDESQEVFRSIFVRN